MDEIKYLYDVKTKYVTQTEDNYLKVIERLLPEGYVLYPQVPLASVIIRTDDSKFHNELFRIIDAGVFDKQTFKPIFLIEINDQTHNKIDRTERDKKVKMICEEAGLPLLKLWTNYGINETYIAKKISEKIEESKNPQRIAYPHNTVKEEKKGCYIATCVYKSYDCPQVWTLRRYRDNKLSKSITGRIFINTYYAISPKLVKLFGKKNWFIKSWKWILDKKVKRLNNKGYKDTPYYDND